MLDAEKYNTNESDHFNILDTNRLWNTVTILYYSDVNMRIHFLLQALQFLNLLNSVHYSVVAKILAEHQVNDLKLSYDSSVDSLEIFHGTTMQLPYNFVEHSPKIKNISTILISV